MLETFKIKVYYTNGYQIAEITGKNFLDAYSRFYKAETKRFKSITGYELLAHIIKG